MLFASYFRDGKNNVREGQSWNNTQNEDALQEMTMIILTVQILFYICLPYEYFTMCHISL